MYGLIQISERIHSMINLIYVFVFCSKIEYFEYFNCCLIRFSIDKNTLINLNNPLINLILILIDLLN